jgi:prephenate dehydratase
MGRGVTLPGSCPTCGRAHPVRRRLPGPGNHSRGLVEIRASLGTGRGDRPDLLVCVLIPGGNRHKSPERGALQVRCADQPGELAKILRRLANADVNIDGILEVSICQREVIFAISAEQLDDARAALGEQAAG